MPYLPLKIAAGHIGIKPKSLQKRYQVGRCPTIIQGGERLYWVPDDLLEDNPPDVDPDPVPLEYAPDENTPYEYEQASDTYWFSMPQGLLKISGAKIREALTRYSGEKDTVNGVANYFGWKKEAVRRIFKALGKTKDSAPFTDEEIQTTPEEELIASTLRKKEGRVLRRAQQQRQKRLEDDAFKWRRHEAAVREVFEDLAKVPPSFPAMAHDPGEQTVMAWHTDAHVGSLAAGWGLEECRRILLGSLECGLQRAEKHGKLGRILLPVGSDWYDIDTWKKTTTNGTPQDTVLPQDVVRWGTIIKRDMIALAAEYAVTDVIPVPGNHDRMNTHHAGAWLELYYENHPNVNVHQCKNRHFLEQGANMFMFAHGDGAKPAQYGEIMSAEAPELWGRSKWRWAFHGHLHHWKVLSLRGATVTQLGSMAPTDNYHDLHAYTGITRALHVHMFHDEFGLGGVWPVYVSDDGKIFG